MVQATRFMNLLINFLREEKAIAEAPHAPQAAAAKHETAVEGQIQDRPQEPIGADGQHSIEANTGSVT